GRSWFLLLRLFGGREFLDLDLAEARHPGAIPKADMARATLEPRVGPRFIRQLVRPGAEHFETVHRNAQRLGTRLDLYLIPLTGGLEFGGPVGAQVTAAVRVPEDCARRPGDIGVTRIVEQFDLKMIGPFRVH